MNPMKTFNVRISVVKFLNRFPRDSAINMSRIVESIETGIDAREARDKAIKAITFADNEAIGQTIETEL